MKKSMISKLNGIVKELVTYKKLYKLSSERKDLLTSQVKEIMELEGIESFESEVGPVGINRYNRNNFDMKGFKAKYPEIYSEFCTTEEVVRLDIEEIVK